MLTKTPSHLEVIIAVVVRVLMATVCTVAGMIAVGYLAKLLAINPSLIIPLSIISGFCGFIFSIYWVMTYLVKSGYATKK